MPAILSRGYQRNTHNAIKVDATYHSAHDVGDEALMLAHYFPCYVGKNKTQIAKMAIADGADVLIMDDGFQNASLYQNLRIIVIDGYYGFGNHLLFPAGPMREKTSALKRASLVVLLGEDRHDIISELKKYNINFLQAGMIAKHSPDKEHEFFAFTGIGVPDKFFQHLKHVGYEMKQTQIFPNHHIFTNREMVNLFEKARRDNLKLITTEKDWVRVPKVFRAKIHCHQIEMVWSQENDIDKRLENFIYYTDCIV